ncbi:hypothetical protein ACP26F_17675 [Franconibacter pulveris 1160]|uniref:hypothetical protein n=1 Tax=Franconibacter pulveris TaxID=435910 RepID=UPI0004648395|nr:hypothetical protein [Franconibacter pulveris]
MNVPQRKELALAGHALAKKLNAGSDAPFIEVAKLVSDLSTQLDITRAALREKTKQCDVLLVALEKYEQAFEEMFAQCCSNPVFDAWGKPVKGLSTLSEAHFIAGKAIAHVKGGAA